MQEKEPHSFCVDLPGQPNVKASLLIKKEDLLAKVAEIGESITNDFGDKSPLLIGILKGAFIFLADLVRAVDMDVETDFMAVASYGAATKTSGVVRIAKDLDTDIQGRNVIIIEDIVDSGLTLSYLRKGLLARNPASLTVCSLLVKDGQQKTALDIKYVGFKIEPCFVVGYGLDIGQRYRNLPGIYSLDMQ